LLQIAQQHDVFQMIAKPFTQADLGAALAKVGGTAGTIPVYVMGWSSGPLRISRFGFGCMVGTAASSLNAEVVRLLVDG
jgi:hypothetical protein